MPIRPSMHREPLNNLLKNYQERNPDHLIVDEFIRFVNTHANCFERSLQVGHITGSAWIVDPIRHKTLLVHHKKLGRWLQPGGHCDGDPDVAQVAQRETAEETGLSEFHRFSDEIFDLDVHPIPIHKNIPGHLHYDVRFLIHADSRQTVTASEESHSVAWFDLKKVVELTPDDSVARLVQKTSMPH